MRAGWAILGVALLPSGVLAGWVPMSGAEIGAALTDARLVYDSGWQEFYGSGRTLYNAGSDSWGNWRVEGDRYCSQWPPAEAWACYGMARETGSGDLRFEAENGNLTVGHFAE